MKTKLPFPLNPYGGGLADLMNMDRALRARRKFYNEWSKKMGENVQRPSAKSAGKKKGKTE